MQKQQDHELMQTVRHTLDQHPACNAGDIRVKAKSGEITLKGNVNDVLQARAIVDTVRQVSGVASVNNKMELKDGFARLYQEYGRRNILGPGAMLALPSLSGQGMLTAGMDRPAASLSPGAGHDSTVKERNRDTAPDKKLLI